MGHPAPHKPVRSRAERDALALQWGGLPGHVAWRMRGRLEAAGMSLEDAEAEGRLGLLRAAELWEPGRGVKFNTYAFTAVWSHIKKAAERQHLVPVPNYALRAGVEPMNWSGPFQHMPGAGGPEGYAYGAFEPRSREPAPPEAAGLAELRPALRRLPPRWRQVVRLRYFEGLTLEQTGKALCVTKERIRQVELKALARLRRLLGGRP